jgi:hypothetical protein
VRALWCLWQLPQWIVAKVLCAKWKADILHSSDSYVYTPVKIHCCDNRDNGVSFGTDVFIPSALYANVENHELGHCHQSHYLGPLYLLLVGLPSVIRFAIDQRHLKAGWTQGQRDKWYYTAWPEGPGGHCYDKITADYLGGVKRFT